jgi:hypothetical protein
MNKKPWTETFLRNETWTWLILITPSSLKTQWIFHFFSFFLCGSMDGVTIGTSPPLPKLDALQMCVMELKWELDGPKVNAIELRIPKLLNVGSQLASYICFRFMTTNNTRGHWLNKKLKRHFHISKNKNRTREK